MPATLPERLLAEMKFRCIGPPRGGRVVAVAGDPNDVATFYFGAVAGGVWKTTDAGNTWQCVSDRYFKTSSVGALEVAPSAPTTLYAGMGEATIRTDVSYGDGVYKSSDGGRTWSHCGLADTRHIGRIAVHPRDADTAYVAALGHAFGPNEERGLFRTRDGGATWEKVLFVSDKAGAVDVSIDWQNPGVVYATIWQVRRSFWMLDSGGPDSGLWRSNDGGETWSDISRAKGMPKGALGKIGVAASPAQAGRVWALVEAKDGSGLYRSDDFGETWKLTCDAPELRRRPWYYMHVFADPQDAETVYVCNLGFHKSTDGGKTFTEIATPHGDNHALWLDPKNPRRMIEGHDGGACVSFNGGESFSTVYNQLTAQIYHLATDNRFPYHVYGTQQDNSSIGVPSDTVSGAIAWGDCYPAGTGESGYITVDPNNEDIVYVGAVGSSPGGLGALQKWERKTEQIQLVNVWPQNYGGDIAPKSFKYRFPWTFPILFSPHDPGVLYTAANVVFRSTTGGQAWEPISPDLTRNDPEKQLPSGGAITLDNSAAEIYCTIATLRESSREPGLFWAGSDDGLVHISRDGGKTWQNVTPPDLPEWTWVRILEPSPHDPAVCYLAATRYKLDDNTPYLYKTADYGATWARITAGIPAHDYTRVIRADPNRAGVLYAGTETGLYLSLDDGASWQRWEGNLPVAPIFDLAVKGSDLIVATHGRSFWILDDLTPLYQVDGADATAGARLFAPRPATRVLPDLNADWYAVEGKLYGIGLGSNATSVARRIESGQIQRTYLDAGEGAPRSAVVYYALPASVEPNQPITLAFVDGKGTVLREFKPKPEGWDGWDDKQKATDPGPWIPVNPGTNRFVWNLRLEGALRLPGNKTAPELNEGPYALPGEYTVRLAVGTDILTAPLTVTNDPRVVTPLGFLEEQHALLLRIRDQVSAIYRGLLRLRDVREQVEGWQKRLAGNAAVQEAAKSILEKLAAVEDVLIIPGEQKETYHLIVRPRLNEALASLTAVVGSADARPTQQARDLVEQYCGEAQEELAKLDAIVKEDVGQLNELIAAAGTPAVVA